MTGKPGTIENIVADLRALAEARRRSGKALMVDDKMFDLLADEIEETVRYERGQNAFSACYAGRLRSALHGLVDGVRDYCGSAGGSAGREIITALSASLEEACDVLSGRPIKEH